ncbi:hypothetical protein TA3x_002710 [Tundrisphaera sp. TA3]|uniref:hypothetical protein n=1 Tax=Tundrisphaera sp. TA3 TaxID=3435775 RepID=UPI003EC0E5C5
MGFGRTISSIPFGFDRHGRPLRAWRRRPVSRLRDCFAYPLVDGPGLGLLIGLPPFLAIMALPVLDLIVRFSPENALNPVNLLILPFSLPLVTSFTLTSGYLLLFLGRTLESSSIGEEDHPRWPIWDRVEILEEIGRWAWAGLLGIAVGGIPAGLYATSVGLSSRWSLAAFAVLVVAGLSYAQMALIAALLHDTPLAANPVTIGRALVLIGRANVAPSLLIGGTLAIVLSAWYFVLFHSPSVEAGVLGLWACWVLTLYAAMAIVRILGTTYHRHCDALGWFNGRSRRAR